MNNKTTLWLSLLMITVCFGFAFYLYPSLPDQVPIHWNAEGQIDAYGSKVLGVFLMPASALMVFLLMWAVKLYSPKGYRVDEFIKIVNIFQVVLIAYLAVISGLQLLAAKGIPFDMTTLTGLAIGLQSTLLGNYMGKVRKNFFIGIRTPWTLASDEVWNRTHRLAGWLLMLSGLIIIIGTLGRVSILPLIIVLLSAALFSVAYSFFLYKRLEGFTDNSPV